MSSAMRRAMVFLGLSDDDYDEYQRSEQHSDSARGGFGSGADYSRGTTSIRPSTRPESSPPGSRSASAAASGPRSVATLARPTVVRSVEPVDQAPVRVHVIEPVAFGDAQEIGDKLQENQPVIITLSDLEADLVRRLIDFCSGATYVLGGTMERVAKNVFLLTPSNVEVPPEEKERLRERGLYRS